MRSTGSNVSKVGGERSVADLTRKSAMSARLVWGFQTLTVEVGVSPLSCQRSPATFTKESACFSSKLLSCWEENRCPNPRVKGQKYGRRVGNWRYQSTLFFTPPLKRLLQCTAEASVCPWATNLSPKKKHAQHFFFLCQQMHASANWASRLKQILPSTCLTTFSFQLS